MHLGTGHSLLGAASRFLGACFRASVPKASFPSRQSEEYFQLLRVIRSAQWLQECGPGKAACDGDRFKRPLGHPRMHACMYEACTRHVCMHVSPALAGSVSEWVLTLSWVLPGRCAPVAGYNLATRQYWMVPGFLRALARAQLAHAWHVVAHIWP